MSAEPHDRRLSWTKVVPPVSLLALVLVWGDTPAWSG
jgi:prephenate dehydrogenase